MEINYWIISPNVHNDATEQRWKEIIAKRKNAYIGFAPDNSTGVTFHNQIKEGDVIIVAQGANRNKRSYLSGIVSSPAIAGEEEDTPGYAQRRALRHSLSEEELSALNLSFNGCAYGDADRIPALYKLKPWKNINDQRIASSIIAAINQKRIDELMENIKLSAERQYQLKALWEKYKLETKAEDKDTINKEIENLIVQWKQYKDKIKNDTLGLDDYTNTLGSATAIMPGGYLCNFLERTSRTVLGSSKPGTAFNFEVKLNNDNATYYILRQKKQNASRAEAESYFNDTIKSLLKDIMLETDPLATIHLVQEANYSANRF